ncbi:MAG: hydantoinase/oxoprolinase family protein [Oscillibacter sp.]|nr:hydantoinase/oxoprolinase family protein [Oscillibacter sp.]
MRLAIGIDTGGTCTDAVLYDLDSGRVLGRGKALTTHRDLTQGILAALDLLDPQLCRQARVAGLSTTLATNACVEGKFRRPRLLLLGIDRQGIERFGADYGFRDPDEIRYLPCETTITGQILRQPDWALLRANAEEWFRDAEGCAVCEIYAMRNGGVLERKAAEILQEELGLPVVCASDLFSGLSSLERAAGALLNAGLVPVMRDFLQAVQTAFAQRGITARMFITRSDSSLMSLRYAERHAVESLLSGPAASALGGSALTGQSEAVIVDMGGTTTDIALVQHGAPLLAEEGISVGGWRTQVRGLLASSFALGGDSVIRWHRSELTIGPRRVIPLCVLAEQFPQILPVLERQVRDIPGHSLLLHEFLTLSRLDWSSLVSSDMDQKLCQALAHGPLSLQQAADLLDVDKYQLSTDHLERAGIVLRAGLTPTDIMHLRGDYTQYNLSAARLGARFAASSLDLSVDELCRRVYELVSRELFFGISRLLLEHASPYFRQHGLDGGVRELLRLQWEQRNAESGAPLRCTCGADTVLVGVGGPIHLFLPEAARALGLAFEIPPHAPAANAVGAIAGRMAVSLAGEVRPCGTAPDLSTDSEFEALCPQCPPRRFPLEQEAIQWAEEHLRSLAAEKLRAQGGPAAPEFHAERQELTAPSGVSRIKLGVRIHVTAEARMIQLTEGE